MANVNFFNVVAKDGQTAAQRFAALTKQAGTFYKVADAGEEVHYYLEDQLISADKAAEISVLDAAGVFDGANVEAVLNELYHDALAEKVWFVDETPASGSPYSAIYKFYQGENAPDAVTDPATLLGTINIAKDMVVEDGSVVDIVFVEGTGGDPDTLHEGSASGTDVTDLIVPSGQVATEAMAGKYIKLIIANVTNPLYIFAKDLVDIYTGGANSETSVAIDANNVIKVTIIKIAGTKIIYRAEDYPQVTVGDTFDNTETYYTYDAVTDTYSVDATVDATNFDTKVAAGLYTHVTELNINAKVDEVEAALNALKTYVGTIPQSSSASTVIEYVDEKTGAGVDALNGEAEIASKSVGNIVTIKGGIVETEGIIANSDSAPHATVVDGYYYEGKFYQEQAHTTEITPEKTKSYNDLDGSGVYNWTEHEFVLVRADITLAKVAVTGAAEDVAYDNTTSQLTADDVQEAIDELATRLTWVDV